MLINFKVKTLDAQTHELSVDNEITVRELKDKIAEKTNIRPEQQRIIYCGRVLADERPIKDFDVDGKVLHVAERPPPSQGGPSTSSRANDNPPIRDRSAGLRGMRHSPLFRALDGMVVGSVSLPNNNSGRIVNPFASSSSFCMNRITVARHMLECANNIAAYLENPQRGLNNTSLDILQRGRWTMESTVVEVGISTADLPQGQNIVEMVQGAVTAALRGEPSNVTVVQLPPVFDTEGSVDESIMSRNDDENSNSDNRTATTVIIQNVSDSDDEPFDGETTVDSATIEAAINDIEARERDIADEYDQFVGGLNPPTHDRSERSSFATSINSADGGNNAQNDNEASATNAQPGAASSENGGRRRTPPTVLAEVIELWRTVQNRLNPFIDQFYEILNNEPNFEEGTNQREDAQRLFDRVSEAFHYMSHATHAISDLMLDFSLPTPRYLTCRPILVEQSGYISSNNFLSTSPLLNSAVNNRRNFLLQQRQTQTDNVRRNVNSQASNTNITGNISTATNVPTTNTSTINSSTTRYDDPIDNAPSMRPQLRPVSSMNVGTQSTDSSPIPMARLIQAVVNGAPIDTEFHVQINTPIVSFGVPVNVASVHADPPSSRSNLNTPQQTPRTTSENQVRSNTATLPTISTQTRPTSRPQVQMGSFPGSNRLVPNTPVVHSFDRFLPCNSHHIRDAQNANNNNNNARTNNNSPRNTSHGSRSTSNNSNVSRSANSSPANVPVPRIRIGSTRSSSEPRTVNVPQRRGSSVVTLRNILSSLGGNNANFRTDATDTQQSSPAEDNDFDVANNLREQLLSFVTEHIFQGNPINDENMPTAIERVVRWFAETLIFLPQYEKPEYDSRDSLINILRQTMPVFINLLIDPLDTAFEFEQNLRHLFDQFMKRLYSVLCVCVGRSNADLYWVQLMRIILVPLRLNFRDEALSFLRIYINPSIPASPPDTTDAQKFVVHRQTTSAAIKSKERKGTFTLAPSKPTTNADIDMTDAPSTSSSSLRSEKKFTNPLSEGATSSKQKESSNTVVINNLSQESAPSGGAAKITDAEKLGDTSKRTEAEGESIEPAEPLEPLPTVETGSEPWHSEFPAEWLPLITRDIQTINQDQTTQGPFSDAYISGMAAKRRKLIQNTKPTATPTGLLTENLRSVLQTVQTSSTNNGSSNESSITDITNTMLNDTAVTTSYTEALRSSLRGRIRRDPDYDPSKFPGIRKFLDKK